jgi:hypothetical protein
MRRVDSMLSRHRPSAWAWLVTVSACLIIGGAIAMAIWFEASREKRVATYAVRGALEGVALDLGGASADIVGGGPRAVVEVRRTDEFAFGQQASAERAVAGGILRLRSRCPATVLGSCSAAYRLTVPDNVPVTVRTSTGNVRFTSFRGSATVDTRAGNIAVGGFCGFSLHARADSGDVSAVTACAPERLDLRSRTGGVHAVVPPGRYRVDADSDSGRRTVQGLISADDAAFQIQALSSTGDVSVEAAP